MKKINLKTIILLACIFFGLSGKMKAQTGCLIAPFTFVPAGAFAGGIYTGQDLFIGGPITINAPVTFDNCNIKMDATASITLLTGPTTSLTITNRTHIFSCSPSMWIGINQGTLPAPLIINGNSLIEDATTAVTLGKGNYNIDNVVFNRNSTSISFLSTTGSIVPTNNIRNTVFTSRTMPASYFNATFGLDATFSSTNVKADIVAGLLPSGLLNSGGTVSLIGIKINSIGGVQIGDDGSAGFLNTFDNMNKGININASSVVVYNNQFLNQPLNAAIGLTSPIGIFAQGVNTAAYTLTIGGAGLNQGNGFSETWKAIDIRFYRSVFVYNNTLRIKATTLNTGVLGISVWPADASTTEVFNNGITNYSTGINIKRNTTGLDATDIKVDGNTITTSQANGVGYCKFGIDLSDPLQTVVGMATDKYKVRGNTITKCFTCIVATNVYLGLTIYDNLNLEVVHSTVAGTTTGSGIEIQNCFKPRVLNNTISSTDNTVLTGHTGTYPANVTPWYHGIWDNASTKSSIECNTITGLGESMTFSNNAVGFNFILNNTMSQGQHGLALRSGFVLGQQGDATHPIDLLWNTSAGNGFTKETYVDNVTNNANTASVLFLDNTPTGGYITFPTLNWSPVAVNTYGAGLQAALGTYYDCNNIAVQAIVAGGGGNGDILAARELIPLANDTTNYQQFTSELQYQNKAVAYSVLDSTNGAVADDTSGVLQSYYDSAKYTTMGQLKEVGNAIAAKDYATADVTNNSVTASNQIQANEKLVNYYYLLQQNNPGYQYTAGDSSAIYSIASQCQSQGGNVVWQARMMYFDIIGERVSFDDYCLEEGKSMVHNTNTSAPKQSNNVRLYPNPNNGNFTLEYHLEDNETGSIAIYDIAGKLIKNYTLNASNASASIDADAMEAGIYLYDVLINNTKVKNDKLVIIK